MREEITIDRSEYRRLVNAEAKLDMLIDALLNNAKLSCDQLYITSTKLEVILMTFESEGYKGAVEWLKKKEGK